MRETYVTEDLLNTLIALEMRGHENYLRLEGQAPDPRSRELFKLLADQELKHKTLYESFKAHLEGAEPADPEYLSYVGLLLEKQIPVITAPDVPENFEACFQLAVTLEKETLFFLHEVKSLLPFEARGQVNPMIDEERKHLQYLLEYR